MKALRWFDSNLVLYSMLVGRLQAAPLHWDSPGGYQAYEAKRRPATIRGYTQARKFL